ncbi:MAG: HAD-IA family hydrolase, partial [Candidatus Gastranaerophilales bacterium]|nr:HAD-IA family hydrolase [Candidatus Gastranaerophilales bacterium]
FKGINSLKNCFRITSPKLEDVEKIINLVVPKPLFVFDLDGVVFDVKDSYRLAIKKTFEHFAKIPCDEKEIQLAKNKGGLSNDWDLTAYLIEKSGRKADYNELVEVFQNYFYREGKGGFIDNEKLVFDAEFFEKLTKFADCAVFTGRPRAEAFYSLEKFNIKKYFSYFVCNEDVEGNYKPSPYGLNKIKQHCPHKEILYFGDTIDDIIAGKSAGVKTFGVILPGAVAADITSGLLIEQGAFEIIKNKNDILEKIYANS